MSQEFAFQSDFDIVFLGWVSKGAVGVGGLERLTPWDVSWATKECSALHRIARVRRVHRTLSGCSTRLSSEAVDMVSKLLHQRCSNHMIAANSRNYTFFCFFFREQVTLLPSKSHCFQPELFLRAIAKGSRFQSRFSLRSEDLMEMMRSGKSSTKSLGSTVSVAMVGWEACRAKGSCNISCVSHPHHHHHHHHHKGYKGYQRP